MPEHSYTPTPQRARGSQQSRRQGQRMTKAERQAAQESFLRALGNTANVRAACLQAGIHVTTVYYWQEHDVEFGIRFRQANDDANWLLFGEAWRRAVQGDEEPVVSGGKVVLKSDGTPLTIRRKSDPLLALLLKARIPIFRNASASALVILPKEYVGFDAEKDGVDS
jgi:hypothetical protein